MQLIRLTTDLRYWPSPTLNGSTNSPSLSSPSSHKPIPHPSLQSNRLGLRLLFLGAAHPTVLSRRGAEYLWYHVNPSQQREIFLKRKTRKINTPTSHQGMNGVRGASTTHRHVQYDTDHMRSQLTQLLASKQSTTVCNSTAHTHTLDIHSDPRCSIEPTNQSIHSQMATPFQVDGLSGLTFEKFPSKSNIDRHS